MRQNVASTISCKRENALFDGKDILSNFKTVEKHLEIESSEIIFENMTNANLQNAAEMFLYLNSCPDVLNHGFYFTPTYLLTIHQMKLYWLWIES